MSFLSGLSSIFSGASAVSNVVQGASLALGAAGAVTSFIGSRNAAEALESQASQITGLSQRESQAIREIAETEAQLIEAESRDEAAVLDFNIAVARSNADWERRAGEIALEQARIKWERQVKSVIAAFGASGARFEGTTNDIVAEQVAEMEKDLFVLGLNTERAVALQEDQARIFSLQKDQLARRGTTRARARRRIGEIESETALLTGAARSEASMTSAGTARIAGFSSALRSGGSLLGDVADFLSN